MNFDNNKKLCLAKDDKSKIGRIDARISGLVDCINQSYDYTTSSCSGRTVLQIGERKGESEWLFVKHDILAEHDIDDILNILNILDSIGSDLGEKVQSGDVWFRMESLILHIACRSLENAQALVNFARNNGFRRAGIQSTNKKIIVEIIGPENINTILVKDKSLIVRPEYVKHLAEKANDLLQKNWKKIESLKRFFSQGMHLKNKKIRQWKNK